MKPLLAAICRKHSISSRICSKFTASTEYLSTASLREVPAAGYSLPGMASRRILQGPAAVCVSLPPERSVFSGQLSLFSSCTLMISGIFQVPSWRVGKVPTSVGLTMRDLFCCMKTWLRCHSPPGRRGPLLTGLTKALGLGAQAGAPGLCGFCQRVVL